MNQVDLKELDLKELDGNELDWNGVWKSRVKASTRAMGGYDCARSFDNKASAQSYWKMVVDAREFVTTLTENLPFTKESRVLDIGAGPGTLTIPLAARTARVTAVEPAGAMAAVLEDNIRDQGLSNARCIQKKWEDVSIETDLEPPYDLVVASFSLGMPDMRPAIEKMIQVCCGHVVLIWFAGPPSWDDDYNFISNTLFDRKFPEMPKGDILFNILYQMDIFPEVSVFPGRMDHYYPGLDRLMEELTDRMPAVTGEGARAIHDYYSGVVEKRGEGIVLPYTWNSMKFTWKVE